MANDKVSAVNAEPKKAKKSGKGVDYYRQEAYSWRKMYTRLEGEWREFLKMIKDLAVQLGEEKLRREQAEARLAEMENALTFDTTCLTCAQHLNASIQEYERAEKAEYALAEFERKVLAGEIGGPVIRKPRITNHAFEGDPVKPCKADLFGIYCGGDFDLHDLKDGPRDHPTPDKIVTEGCDCGHDGMDVQWHAKDCFWRSCLAKEDGS